MDYSKSWTKPGQNFFNEGTNSLADINRDIEGNGGTLGGFSVNFKNTNDEKKALKTITAFAKKNRISDYGTYIYTGMGSAKGKTQVYIKNNKVDVSDLFREVGVRGEVVGKTVAGMKHRGSFK